MKTSGFNIEDTHLADLDRLEKLFSLVMIAFTWAYLVGLWRHEHLKHIRLLRHGYRAKTFFKQGLEAISAALLSIDSSNFTRYGEFLSCT